MHVHRLLYKFEVVFKGVIEKVEESTLPPHNLLNSRILYLNSVVKLLYVARIQKSEQVLILINVAGVGPE